MRTNLQQVAGRTARAWGWPLRIASWTGAAGVVLFLALLLHSVPAHGVLPPGSESVTLAWERSASADIVGYRVYFGAQSGVYTGSVEAGDAATHTVPGLLNDVTYFFAVKAYAADGRESAFSNEISFVPGLVSLQIRLTASSGAVLTLRGPAGRAYQIQATTDFRMWTAIGNVTMDATGLSEFADTAAANFVGRFYRTQRILP